MLGKERGNVRDTFLKLLASDFDQFVPILGKTVLLRFGFEIVLSLLMFLDVVIYRQGD